MLRNIGCTDLHSDGNRESLQGKNIMMMRKNTHDWNNEKPYEGDLQTLNGK